MRIDKTGREANQKAITLFAESKKKKGKKRHRVSIRVEAEECQNLLMHGRVVKFPGRFTPYGSQKMIIHKNIYSFDRGLNVLVESPTGSGKTMALLSSSLAWLHDYNNRRELSQKNCLQHGRRKIEDLKEEVNKIEELLNNIKDGSEIKSKRKKSLDSSENIDFDDIFGFKKEGSATNKVPELFKKTSLDTIPYANTLKKKAKSEIVALRPETKCLKENISAKLLKSNSFLSNNGKMHGNKSIKSEVIRQEGNSSDEVTDCSENKFDCTCLPKVRIYFATRTHKQIAQVVKEFKRLPYGHDRNVRHTILSSRENCCVNNAIKHSNTGDITSNCIDINSTTGKKSPDKKGCTFKNNVMKSYIGKYKELRNELIENDTPVWDLEEIVEYGEARGLCPYYVTSTILRSDADLVFCPFNYLIDPVIRRNTKTTLKNDIVILDEAHNVEDVCRSSSSFEFSEKEVIHSLNDIYNKHQKILAPDMHFGKIDDIPDASFRFKEYETKLNTMLGFFKNFLKWFRSFADEVLKISNNSSYSTTNGKVYTTQFIYQSLGLFDLDCYIKNPKCLEELQKVWKDLSHDNGESIENPNEKETKQELKLLTEALDFFRPCMLTMSCIEKFVYFCYFIKRNPSAYRLYYSITESTKDLNMFSFNYQKSSRMNDSNALYLSENQYYNGDSSDQQNEAEHLIAGEQYNVIKERCVVKLNLWCMDPSICFIDAFNDTLSVVLASGTLSPIGTFTSELGMEFTQIGQGRQVIPKEQIFTCIVPKGPNGIDLICSKDHLDKQNKGQKITTIEELAYLIFDVCKVVDKGILIFLPNYNFIDLIFDAMIKLRLMNKLKEIKKVLKEPKKGGELESVINQYKRSIESPSQISSTCTGAVMFAVFRGKISEGIDFPDDMARCVMSIGIPYPNFGDPQIREKKSYNNMFYKQKKLLNGSEWYKTQAFRALNQALGRCLRHRGDWGAILLVDYRFSDKAHNNDLNMISKWVIENLRPINDYGSLIENLKTFIKERNLGDSNSTNETTF
uniref:Helicase ATP-binding domain-containing protein n=1 Tax=Strongyloides papillosus TaxID=174720 RepID=A0A0N5B8B5_STREA